MPEPQTSIPASSSSYGGAEQKQNFQNQWGNPQTACRPGRQEEGLEQTGWSRPACPAGGGAGLPAQPPLLPPPTFPMWFEFFAAPSYCKTKQEAAFQTRLLPENSIYLPRCPLVFMVQTQTRVTKSFLLGGHNVWSHVPYFLATNYSFIFWRRGVVCVGGGVVLLCMYRVLAHGSQSLVGLPSSIILDPPFEAGSLARLAAYFA